MPDQKFEVKILKVKILSFSFTHKDSLENPNIDENEIDFTFNSSIGLKVNSEKELIEIKHSIKVFLPNGVNEIINLQVLSTYVCRNLKQFEVSENEYNIPEEIIDVLIVTSVSNTRGVLSVKVNETGFNNIILPLIHMEDLQSEKVKNK